MEVKSEVDKTDYFAANVTYIYKTSVNELTDDIPYVCRIMQNKSFAEN